MVDRQKVEAILTHRFPSAAVSQLAAAANAIMGLAGPRLADRAHEADAPAQPTTTVVVFADIEAPTRRVFDLFTDLQRATEHVSGIKQVELLTPGRFALGTRWHETREVFGHLDTVEMEVIAFERDRTYTLSHYKAGVRVEIVFAFEPDHAGTRVTITFTLDGAGMPSGFMTPLNWVVAGKVRHVLNHDLADLKRCLERQASTAPDCVRSSSR